PVRRGQAGRAGQGGRDVPQLRLPQHRVARPVRLVGVHGLRHHRRGEHHRLVGGVRRGRWRVELHGRAVRGRQLGEGLRHGGAAGTVRLQQAEQGEHARERAEEDTGRRGAHAAGAAPGRRGPPPLHRGRRAELRPGAEEVARHRGVSLHELPAGEEPAHAHRLQRRAADQRLRPRDVLPQVPPAPRPQARDHRPGPLRVPLRGTPRPGRRGQPRGDVGPAPRGTDEARLDRGRPTARGDMRRGAPHREPGARVREAARRRDQGPEGLRRHGHEAGQGVREHALVGAEPRRLSRREGRRGRRGGVGPSEADPPAFTANRRREARARAVAAGDVELLTSGALDNPDLKGKHSSKWRRDKRSTDRSREMTEMYSQLETDLMEGRPRRRSTPRATPTPERRGKGRPAVSFTRADEAYEPVRPAAVSTLHDTIAYPTGKNQRPVVLPDQATAEELSAPTQRCEDVLDFGAWRDAVPPGAEDEVTYLFRSDDEVAEREAVFNAQNREYLDLQRQREDDRLEAEAAARSKLEDEAAQEEGRRRYLKTSRSRKRRDGLDPHELTTEEALMEVVRTRKISRKINYDAMSSLFDDDGQFSTDLLSDATRNKKEEAM
ncbi:hypothetical protein THAOC_32951, partial [Thalassiosira oceanica]